ncbi:hypothetical protein [Microbulbifer spongiae]|uniref:Uncharacterized protein n=1 Tax=Microbulbifer spongiae TaxID=2944933 RepID=A0ABY9ECW6_9GAMM|nr:hypothetical protein [Microbulbifer sp. MI-G]WKD49908.1 hypothetical protein M8T91_00315 [Microbulbifer sp. MI-G]
MRNLFDRFSRSRKARYTTGVVGLVIAVPFLLWGIFGAMGVVPSLQAVFGISGLRIPAAITIFGLLIAAVGFWDYGDN